MLLHEHLRVEKTTPQGQQTVVRYVSAGELFGVAQGDEPRSLPGDGGRAAVDSIALAWPSSSLHEGSAVNGSVAFASPILIDGTSARRWVRGYRVSQLRLRHLTCGRARSTVPHHNASCTRRSPGETRPT